MKDVAEFPSSLHFTAWKIGAWPVLLTGTQTTMSLGRIISSLSDFCRRLRGRCEFHHNAAESSSEAELGGAKNAKLRRNRLRRQSRTSNGIAAKCELRGRPAKKKYFFNPPALRKNTGASPADLGYRPISPMDRCRGSRREKARSLLYEEL